MQCIPPDAFLGVLREAASKPLPFTFSENSESERACFGESWNARDAVTERAALMNIQRTNDSPEVVEVMTDAEGFLGVAGGVAEMFHSSIPGQSTAGKRWNDYSEKYLEPMAQHTELKIGGILLEWIEKRNFEAIAQLADAVKSLAQSENGSESIWKRRIMSAFLELSQGDRLPTKGEVRKVVDAHPTQGEGLDDRRFRRYLKALGLSGLPAGRPGPRKK